MTVLNLQTDITAAVPLAAFLLTCLALVTSCSTPGPFPYGLPEAKPDRPLSAAMERLYEQYLTPMPETNELYSKFRYTPLTGLDYHGHDGTVTRRDPSKVIRANGRYYVWYTKRHTPEPPRGPGKGSDTAPSTDWDLSEIWYATSEDGFEWEEQGLAVRRPPKPEVGWRSVSTPDILVWKGKYYLYYQGFLEMSGKRGDDCPVTASVADSPDGPWTPAGKIVVPNGPPGAWDQCSVHDPYPLVYKGRIYLYYKADMNGKPVAVRVQGLAIADDPFGPFEKHPLNPVLNSGHETALWPFREGIAAMAIRHGLEHNTIQYAPDGVNFQVASIASLMPIAGGPYVPDAFTDSGDGRGITWGLCHFTNAGTRETRHSILARFDCDLSRDHHDPWMKKTEIWFKPEVYFSQGLNKQQRQRAIDDVSAAGGGRLILPRGTYRFARVYLKSNVHLLIEKDTVVRPYWPKGTKAVVFILDAQRPSGKKPDAQSERRYIENVSIRGLGGRFTVDYSDRKRAEGEGIRAVLCRMVRNFLISDLDVKDNFTVHCGITLTPTRSKVKSVKDWKVSRATDGTIRNCRIFNASPGYGLVQLHGAQSVHFEDICARGGVALRLETGALGNHTAVFDITAKNVTCENGRCAVMLGPHSAVNGFVHVDGVTAKSCAYAVTIGLGGVKKAELARNPKAVDGRFADGSSIRNIHAIFGKNAQIKTHAILEVPEEYYDDLRLRDVPKFFDGPSIGAVKDATKGAYRVIVENVTLEGFKHNKGKKILTPEDARPGKWPQELRKWKAAKGISPEQR